ncbi:SET and MYND domain-containing protein 4 [Adelges cooleyi]|uniref:SET and MYND domain-containing protein 4 n=1 Tax=Adelges cooleyi TaxID=133065 RepID=UPI0021800C0A|nr:SET and MYND domain-containing protein 4 [Adelges cooleyi]
MMNDLPVATEAFSIRHARFRDTLKPEDVDEFSKFAKDKQKIRFLYRRLYGAQNDDEPSGIGGGYKDGNKALDLKKTGNGYFQKSDYVQALSWYSLAVFQCPQTGGDWSTQLAILYANRSACLYHLNLYDLAIADVQRAFGHGYPDELLYKIHERKARCLLATNRLKSALESFKATLQTLDKSKLSLDKRRKWQLDVQIMVEMLAKDKNAKNESQPRTAQQQDGPPKVYGAPNDTYPAATDAMRIEYDSVEGRHAKASRDIVAGKVVLAERAHASVLLHKYCHSHCTNCFAKLVAPLPCPDCDRVAFCGEPCRETALQSYHAVECSIMPQLVAAGLSVTCLMALRIVTQKPLKYFTGLERKLDQPQLVPANVVKYEPDDYVGLYNLVTHRDSRSVQDVLHRAHLASYLLRCLKTTGYFRKNHQEHAAFLTDDQSFVGSLLLRHLELLQFNAFEVSELQECQQSTVFIGGAVYPTLALLNHSCDPCVVRYHRGTTVVVHTIRDIRAGEPITENYGPVYTSQTKNERQKNLKNRYWFECNCTACFQDWPTLDQVEMSRSLRIKCSSCQNAITVSTESMDFAAKCAVCSKSTNLFKALQVLQDTECKYSNAIAKMDKGDYRKALPEFLALLTLLQQHLVPPFKDYHLCQQAVKKCILSFGNKSLRNLRR